MDIIVERSDTGAAPISDRDRSPLLQRMITTRRPAIRPLYWRTHRLEIDGAGPIRADLGDDGSILVAPGTTLTFDTYFGAFFEATWWTRTGLRTVHARVIVEGFCTVRLLRRIADRIDLLEERVTSHEGIHDIVLVLQAETANFRQHGMVYVEISTNREHPARFVAAAWEDGGPASCEAAARPDRPIGLGVVICTFGRETWLGDVLQAAISDPVTAASFARILIVNQGTPGIRDHGAIAPAAEILGDRLLIVEQRNLGGSGGFTRGIVEALADADLTHVVLLDDDIDLEPDTLVRINAFLSHANDDVALGGHMLDRVQPLRLYEGGAVIDEKTWFVRPVQHDLDLRHPDTLAAIATPVATHYNGWWCFAIGLDLVRKHGLPLPMFLRGDDAEYGTRLGRLGVDTVTVAGIAVWHEPFYLKLGSWHFYYETRNLLVLAALHREASPASLVRRQARSFLIHLLTYRYEACELLLRGIEDFLDGPPTLDRDPRALHAGIVALVTADASARVPRSQVVEDLHVPPVPSGKIGYLAWFVLVLLRNIFVPEAGAQAGTQAGEARRIAAADFSWVSLRRTDVIVLDNGWEETLPLYNRSRTRFRGLARRGAIVLFRLARESDGVVRAWKSANPSLVSPERWAAYFQTHS